MAQVRDFNAQDCGGNSSAHQHNNIVIDGFVVRQTQGAKGVSVCGNNWYVMNSDIAHTSSATDGPLAYVVPTSDSSHEGSSCPCAPSTNINFMNNVVHDSYGELFYMGGGGVPDGTSGAGYTNGAAHSYLTICGNQIYNGGVYGGQGDGIDMKGGWTHVIVSGNTIHNVGPNQGARGIVTQGTLGVDQNNLFERNYIYNNSALEDAALAIVDSWGTPQAVTVRNNVIVNNDKSGIKLYSGSKIAMYNNTIVGAAGLGIESYGTADIINNLIINAGSGPASVSSGTVSYNGYSGSWSGTCNNCLSGLDSSVFRAAGDYHLASGAAPIDHGTTLSSFNVDFDGISRPQGAAWDIGAYEYH
jgi:hypothetical protein